MSSARPRLRLKLVVIALTLLYSGLSKADNTFFPLHPRLDIIGSTGDNTSGSANVMAPLFGSPDDIFYTDVEAKAGKDNSWLGSLGAGERDALNNDLMLGGYVFVDRSKSNNADGGNQWLVFNPGIEFMTRHWDGRVNAYIPSGKRKVVEDNFFGDQIDRPEALTFSGHNQYSVLFNKVEEIGPGIDIDAGYTFMRLNQLRIHGGAYYFNLKNISDIRGVETGAEMPINHYLTLQFDDSYDNVQKNTAVVSLRFTFGGLPKSASEPLVQNRMLDPIYRHLGALNTSAGIPSNNEIIDTHNTALERSNIWFFNASNGAPFNASSGDNNCTFEHPCIGSDFNQTNVGNINNIARGANFYFTPSTYTFGSSFSTSNLADPHRLSLYSGQSMYGRTSNYALPASQSTGFPTFVGGLDLLGHNTLDSFALINNNGSQSIGIHIDSVNNVLINNLQIGNINNAQQSYANSIQLDHADDVTVQHSTIQSDNAALNSTILNANNSSNIIFNQNNSTITDMNTSDLANLYAIQLGNSTATVNNNTFALSGNGATNEASDVAGFKLDGGSTLNATGNIFTITASDVILGIYNIGGNATLTNNQFHLTTVNNGDIAGINTHGGGTLNLINNQFTLTGDGSRGGLYGIYNAGSTVIATNNTFTFSGTATTKTCVLGSYSNNGNTFTGCT